MAPTIFAPTMKERTRVAAKDLNLTLTLVPPYADDRRVCTARHFPSGDGGPPRQGTDDGGSPCGGCGNPRALPSEQYRRVPSPHGAGSNTHRGNPLRTHRPRPGHHAARGVDARRA